MIRILVFCLLLLSSSVFASGENLHLSGSVTFANRFTLGHPEEFTRESGIPLVVNTTGSVDGVRDLLAGLTDAAMISAPYELVLSRAGIKSPDSWKVETLSMDSLVAIVNRDNPIEELNKEELRDIFSGEIANWSKLVHYDWPVMPVIPPDNSGVSIILQDTVMKRAKWALNLAKTRLPVHQLKIITHSPGAIGIFFKSGLARQDMGHYPVKVISIVLPKYPLALVIPTPPHPGIPRLLDFLRKRLDLGNGVPSNETEHGEMPRS